MTNRKEKRSRVSFIPVILVIACMGLLASCGGGSSGGSTATTINGITVPPEPDVTANAATLAGVDSNGNGVRDDVERKIATVASNQAEYDAKVAVAREYQLMLTTTDSTPDNINNIQLVIACRVMNSKGLIGDNRKIRDLISDNANRKGELGKKISNAGGIAIGEEECK